MHGRENLLLFKTPYPYIILCLIFFLIFRIFFYLFQATFYSKKAKIHPTSVDMDVCCNFGRLKYVFLHKFLVELQVDLLCKFIIF